MTSDELMFLAPRSKRRDQKRGRGERPGSGGRLES